MSSQAEAKAPRSTVLASAGTGKTYRLAVEYIRLLLLGAEPDTILATTFTRKAASEILERILLRLAGATVSPEDRNRLGLDLDRFSQEQGLFEDKLTPEHCGLALAQLVSVLPRLRVATLGRLHELASGCVPPRAGAWASRKDPHRTGSKGFAFAGRGAQADSCGTPGDPGFA